MDRSSALKQITMLSLQCSICHKNYPSYRMLITKNRDIEPLRSHINDNNNKDNNRYNGVVSNNLQICEKDNIEEAIEDKDSINQINQKQSITKVEEDSTSNLQDNEESPSTTTQISQINKTKTTQTESSNPNPKPPTPQPTYLCLSCTLTHKIPLPNFHPQTFQSFAQNYISQLPLPNYAVAEQCLELLKEVEARAGDLCKRLIQQIDGFKFYVFGVVRDGRRVCMDYLDGVKYYQQIRIQQTIANIQSPQNPAKPPKKLQPLTLQSQNLNLVSLSQKLTELKSLNEKISTIKLTIPQFGEQQTTTKINNWVQTQPQIQTQTQSQSQGQKRKRIQICDVPISSMVLFKGRKFYGVADGRIVYDGETGMLTLKAHDSLIRSFSHDQQYTLYSGSDDFTIKAWDTHKNQLQLVKTFGMLGSNKSYHRNICVINQGRYLISSRGQFDKFYIRVWELQNQYANVGCLEGHQNFIRAMAVSNKERDLIVTGSDDKTVKIWDAKSFKIIKTIFRPKKTINLIISQLVQGCAIIDQQNRVTIIDLVQNYKPIIGWTMPRKILCSCKYTHKQNDYLALSIITGISIWRWDGEKVWSVDTESTYTPIYMMQVSASIIVSDGTGTVDQFVVGDL